MHPKRVLNSLLGKLGYRLVRSANPDLPLVHDLVHQAEQHSLSFPFWITDQHTKRWWQKDRQDASAELEFLRQYCEPNSVVFDVGAHHGYQSMFAGHLAHQGAVHAFEANPVCALSLDANIGRNRMTNVYSNLMAVGSESKTIRIQGQSIDAQSLDSWEVPMNTLDAYCAQHGITKVDVLKLDVEGFEGEVLKGANDLLKSLPHINLELHLDDIGHFGWQARDVLGLLPTSNSSYEISYIDRELSWTERKPIDQLNLDLQRGVINVFFVNLEKSLKRD